MKRKVYVETSIASYLSARPSADPTLRARQELTRKWWSTERIRFELFISELVLEEASRGDNDAAQRRLRELTDIPSLPITQEISDLAGSLLRRRVIPEKAVEDALHVAMAAHHGLDFLLSWNCRHIANAEVIRRLEDVCVELGLRLPILCTPEQLMGDWKT